MSTVRRPGSWQSTSQALRQSRTNTDGIEIVDRRHAEHPSADEAAHIIGFLQEADEHARDLSLGLVSLHQDETGLSYALQRLASNASDRFGVECVYRQSGTLTNFKDAIMAAHLYLILQEALSSLVTAAQPQHVASS